MKMRLAFAAVITAAVLAFAPGDALAHNANVTLQCHDQQVGKVNLDSYNGTNTVKVWFNGAVVLDTAFGDSLSKTYTSPATSDATLRVKVGAHDDPTGSHGWTFDVTKTSKACIESTTTTTAATTTTTLPPTTTSTTAAPTSTTSTTAPTVTTTAPTATTAVAPTEPPATPPVLTTPPCKPPKGQTSCLPVTGSAAPRGVGLMGVLFVVAGFCVLAVRRRPAQK